MEFTILTAARSGEVLGARWGEIDLENRIWVVPASRMKAQREHRVPLSGPTIELLRALPVEDGDDHVFIGAKAGVGLSTMAMPHYVRRMRSNITVHGFRSSFRDWASEQTSFPHEVCEQALAHTITNKVEAAYRRGDLFEKRRRLMDEWAAYCARPVVTGEVVPLRGASDA